jgi:drug/metabolite transporter (DMT)-like permease
MGYLYALAAFACIGSYLVPARFASVKGLAFFPWMGWGMLVLELFRFDSLKALWAHPLWFWGSFAAGILWAFGQGFGNLALQEISLAKAAVLFNCNSFINITIGLVLFKEVSGLGAILFLIAGGLLLFWGSWKVSSASAVPSKEGDLKKGIIMSLLAGFFWGVYFTPVKALQVWAPQSNLSSVDILSGLMLGGALTGLVWGHWRGKVSWSGRNFGLGIATAGLWLLGTTAFLHAIDTLGLSRAVPIINSNSLVYAGWSLFVFRELPLSQGPKVLTGTFIVIAGIVFLAFS